MPSYIEKWSCVFELFAKKRFFKKDKNVEKKLRVSAVGAHSKISVQWTEHHFWFLFDVNRSTFNEDMLEKRFLHFRSQ